MVVLPACNDFQEELFAAVDAEDLQQVSILLDRLPAIEGVRNTRGLYQPSWAEGVRRGSVRKAKRTGLGLANSIRI